jgi:NodT family efflux transporter outer membrane factor (OMF) lipoprotein
MTLILAVLSACSVGPDYARPDAPMQTTFKEQEGWVLAQPYLVGDREPWWSIYNDPVLSNLEEQVDVSNQTLKESEAAYRQAQAVVAAARAEYFPTVTASLSQQFSQSGRGRTSSSVVSGASTTTVGGTGGSVQGGTATAGSTIIAGGSTSGGVTRIYTVNGGFSWDVDVWGRIRRLVEADVASAQASAADLEAARLAAQGTLAEDYFELRAADQMQILLNRTVEDYKKSLQITLNQYNAGVAAQTDVINARTQLESTTASSINIAVGRQELEHAIAVLIGKPPGEVTIPPAPLTETVPAIPVDVPSTLLERRPDIAEAERLLQADNAEIGVNIAAFYPDLTLSANYGYVGPDIGKLIDSSNRDWSGGPSLDETIFDAGARSAQVEEARALYEQAVASYRQTVLTALQAVEDDLVQARIYTRQQDVQDQAVKDAEKAVDLTLNQYKAGTVAYTNVVVAQATALGDEETDVTLRQDRLVASVALIEALGGGWDQTKLPTPEQIEDPTYGGTQPDACDLAGVLSNIGCW